MSQFCDKSYGFSVSCTQPVSLLSTTMQQAMFAPEDSIMSAFAHLLVNPMQRPPRSILECSI